jgi:hypothetical protein
VLLDGSGYRYASLRWRDSNDINQTVAVRNAVRLAIGRRECAKGPLRLLALQLRMGEDLPPTPRPL